MTENGGDCGCGQHERSGIEGGEDRDIDRCPKNRHGLKFAKQCVKREPDGEIEDDPRDSRRDRGSECLTAAELFDERCTEK